MDPSSKSSFFGIVKLYFDEPKNVRKCSDPLERSVSKTKGLELEGQRIKVPGCFGSAILSSPGSFSISVS